MKNNDIFNVSVEISSGFALLFLDNEVSPKDIQFYAMFFLGYFWLILGFFSLGYWIREMCKGDKND